MSHNFIWVCFHRALRRRLKNVHVMNRHFKDLLYTFVTLPFDVVFNNLLLKYNVLNLDLYRFTFQN